MVKMTMSFSKGKAAETSISHNNRDKNFDPRKAGHRHIKSEYTKLNKILVQKDIHEVYEEQFGEAVVEYNSKQKRKDRKIDDYYKHIKDSSNQRTQYEFIVQVGNKDIWQKYPDRTGQEWQAGKKILMEYEQDFERRHPRLKVYNATVHMDEEGSPHLHLNIVPVAEGYKRGVKKKPSLNKALEQEGYLSDPRDSRALFRSFQEEEQESLAKIANKYNITRIRGLTNKLRDVHEYKEVMRAIESKGLELQIEQGKVDKAKQESSKVQKDLASLKQEKLAQQQELQAKAQQQQILLNNWTQEQKEKTKKELEAYKKQEIAKFNETYKAQRQRFLAQGEELEKIKVTSSEAEKYISRGVLGRVNVDETTENIKKLLKQAKQGEKVSVIYRDAEKAKQKAYAKGVRDGKQAVAPDYSKLKQENADLKAENDVLQDENDDLHYQLEKTKAYIHEIYQTVRDSRVVGFFRNLGKRLAKKSIKPEEIEQPDTNELEEIKAGYHAENQRQAELYYGRSGLRR